MKEIVLQRVIDLIRLKCKGNSTAFAKEIGIPQGTISNYVLGKRALNLETVLAILTSFGDISAEWLLRGEGDITKTDYQEETPIINTEMLNMTLTINSLSKKVNELYEENQRLKEQLKK